MLLCGSFCAKDWLLYLFMSLVTRRGFFGLL